MNVVKKIDGACERKEKREEERRNGKRNRIEFSKDVSAPFLLPRFNTLDSALIVD
jgi:hypothetical protein